MTFYSPNLNRSTINVDQDSYLTFMEIRTHSIANEVYVNKDKLHRIDVPAVVYSCGIELWFKDGFLHRVDGPAVIGLNGFRMWYVEGKLCNTLGGPVIKHEFNTDISGKICTT